MTAAQRLATATSIDLAVARSHADKRTPAQTPVQRTITIGAAGTKGLRTYVQLFVVIASANDIRCDVASNSTFVYAYGFAEDIDATHALYASLVVQMVRASDTYISSGAHRPTPTITARLNFQLAFGARVGQRLAEAREQTQREAKKDRRRPPGTAIALRNKELELRDYYRTASKARGTWQASRATAGYSSAARRAGDRAGKRAQTGQRPGALRGTECAGAVSADNSSARDSQRSKVYAAEEFVRTLFDRAAEHGSNSVEFFGAQLTLPPEARFGSLAGGSPLCRRRAGAACGATAVARGGALASAGPTGLDRCSLRKPRWHRGYRGTRAARRPTGRCVNWWCCTRSHITSVRHTRRMGRSTSRRCAPWPNWSWGPKSGTYCGWFTRKRACVS